MKKKISRILTVILAVFATGALSVFIYLNIAEKVAFFDIPGIPSVEKVTTPMIIHQVREKQTFADEREKYGFFGKPVVLRVSRLNTSVNLQEAKREGDFWLSSNGMANIEIFDKSKGGNIGASVIFGTKNSPVLDIADLLGEGDRLMIDTENGWRYNFKIVKRTAIAKEGDYLLPASSKEKLIILKENTEKVLLIESDLQSTEEI